MTRGRPCQRPVPFWRDMVTMECADRSTERRRRCRLLSPNDPRVSQEPFLSAPYIHQNNEPKYHVSLLRAQEHAKRNALRPQRILWVVAQDKPKDEHEFKQLNAVQIQQQRRRWLQRHDQDTAGAPCIFPLYNGLYVRATEKISKKLSILKHHSG